MLGKRSCEKGLEGGRESGHWCLGQKHKFLLYIEKLRRSSAEGLAED
jgi:hypothetical protein